MRICIGCLIVQPVSEPETTIHKTELLMTRLICFSVTFIGINFFKMLVSTTSTLQGKNVEEYLGIVTAEVIIGANFIKDIMGGLRDFFGGRSATYEKVLQEARQNALSELMQRAQELGANAIIGIDLDFETIGGGGSMLMVVASGTAVRIS